MPPVAVLPAAKHSVAVGQVIETKPVTPDGSAWLDHVAPPFVVAITAPADAPDPAAKHSVVVGQVIELKLGAPDGSAWLDHVAPPSVDVTTSPTELSPYPTAMHVAAVGHATASRIGLPGMVEVFHDMPPSVVTAAY
ncbi:MAG: hypothetical protein M0Z62_03070 [Actinomycetota bacterium]|nr:hypothetical protein [Actinomycetota bacterium]